MSLLKVKTAYGDVVGIMGSDGKHSIFKKVPYAKPPVGELRFTPPQAPDPWDGELICDTFPPTPIQLRIGEDYAISEDCLYLNIYTPAERGDEKLPVMFWIYGGVFQFGFGHEPTYDGAAICAKDCILVTINYRVNIFGFFNTPELEKKNGGAMNFGILDQIAALKWVHENIAAFGGDPDRILIFGQSAGGVSTRMLLVSPLTKGLIARAVAHSGGGMNEADLVRPKDEFTKMCTDAMSHLGWTMADVMQKEPLELLTKMIDAVKATIDVPDLAYFQPFIDNLTLTDVPGVSIYNGDYANVPIMCGSVSGDSWMFTRKVREELGDNMSYFRAFAYSPAVGWARRNAEAGRTPIYSYYMDRKQPPKEHSYWNHGQPPFGYETPHAAELAYIFGTMKDPRFTEYDYKLAEVMRTYWTNFAKYGDPNGEGLPAWPKCTAEEPLSMHFGNEDYKAENLIENADEERVIAFSVKHPGMLTTLDEF